MKKFALALALLMSVSTMTACGESDTPSEACVQTVANPFERGTINGNTYENKFIEAKIVVPDGWTVLSEKEVSTLKSTDATIYDVMAADVESGSNIIVMYEDLTKEIDNAKDMTMLQYVASFKVQMTADKTSTYTPLGDDADVQIAGKTYRKVAYQTTSNTMNGTFYQAAYLRKFGTYIAGFIFTATSPSEITTMESYISAL